MSVKTIKTMLDWVEDNLEEEPGLPQMAHYVGIRSTIARPNFMNTWAYRSRSMCLKGN